MICVVCTKWIPEECVEKYASVFRFVCPKTPGAVFSRQELSEQLKQAEVLFSVAGTPIDKELIETGENLKMIASLGVGYDHVDVAYATEKKIPVVNSPTAVSEPTAEHTIALMMAIFHNLSRYTQHVKQGLWENDAFGTVQTSIAGHTLGIVGMGRIGKHVAQKAASLGMRILYSDLHRLPEAAEKELGATYGTLQEVLAQSDCVTVHVPFQKENYHLFDAQAFAAMKEGAYFINASRGALMDINALTAALKSGKIKGAALDVFEPEPYLSGEILTLENVVLTPHVASETRSARVAMAFECLDGILALSRGETPSNLVNPSSVK
ncbi:MAG: NAD(P)-dependent oxidoreductase [Ruthenibacterium sp.]